MTPLRTAPPGCVGGGCAPTLSSITVEPTPLSMAAGVSQQYRALATYSDGDIQDVTALATWSSTDETVALVASGGLASAVSVGTATVTAAYGGSTGTGSLEITPAQLVSLSISPPSPTVSAGLDLQLQASGSFTDGSVQDLTGQAAWSSSDPAAATISPAGLAHGVAGGSATIEAAVGGVTASTTLAVTGAAVVYVSITPAAVTVARGTFVKFSAAAVYRDGATLDVTSSAAWSSSNGGVATVSSAGQVTGMEVGSAEISAAYGGVTASAPVTVSSATLASLSIDPTTPTIPAGVQQHFTATGIFSDGSQQDLTAQVTWTSSDLSVATVTDAGLAPGDLRRQRGDPGGHGRRDGWHVAHGEQRRAPGDQRRAERQLDREGDHGRHECHRVVLRRLHR